GRPERRELNALEVYNDIADDGELRVVAVAAHRAVHGQQQWLLCVDQHLELRVRALAFLDGRKAGVAFSDSLDDAPRDPLQPAQAGRHDIEPAEVSGSGAPALPTLTRGCRSFVGGVALRIQDHLRRRAGDIEPE